MLHARFPFSQTVRPEAIAFFISLSPAKDGQNVMGSDVLPGCLQNISPNDARIPKQNPFEFNLIDAGSFGTFRHHRIFSHVTRG